VAQLGALLRPDLTRKEERETTLEEFLNRLSGVKHRGKENDARCPNHHDKHASLSVTEKDGWIVFKCFAGCSRDEILAALGLTRNDLRTEGSDWSEPDKTYVYTDEGGAALYEVIRLPGKRFRQRHYDPVSPDAKSDGYVYSLDGVRRVPYKLPRLLKAVAEGRRIYIVEGEKDAERIHKETGRCATCNPGGAGKWKPDYNRFFAGARVIVVQDRDEPGRRHARKIKEELDTVAAEVLIYQAARGNDLSDHLDAGLRMEQMQQPRKGPARGIISAAQMADSGLEYLHLREHDLPGWELIDGIVASTVRPGRLYACGGYTGDGKTCFALQGSRKLASEGVRVGYFSMEMSDTDLRNRLIAHKGVPLWQLERPWLLQRDRQNLALYHAAIEEMREWSLDVVYDTALTPRRVVEETNDREYEFVIIDHIHRLAWGDRRQLEGHVQALTNLSLDLNIPVLILCQLRRYARGREMVAYPAPTLQDLRETEMLGAEASLAFAIWRQRDQEGLRYVGTTSSFRVLKNRHTAAVEDRAGHVEELAFDMQTGLFSKLGVPSAEEPEEEYGWGTIIQLPRPAS